MSNYKFRKFLQSIALQQIISVESKASTMKKENVKNKNKSSLIEEIKQIVKDVKETSFDTNSFDSIEDVPFLHSINQPEEE